MMRLLCSIWFLCCGVAWGHLPQASHPAYCHADGAGNVTALMDAQEGIVARYLYNPFGRLTGKWGPMAEANRYRFSSKEVHAASGLSYYGFRFYDAGLQRWLNPDPLGEGAGPNLYEAFSNNPLLFADRDGLDNMYNMPAGNNAVPDIVASMPVGEGGVISGYREGIDPLFLLGSLTPFDPNQLLSLPGPLNDLVTLASASPTGNEKLQAGAGLAVWALTKGKKLGMLAKPCPAAKNAPLRSNANLVQEVATRSENAIGGTGRFAGTDKHAYAKRLLDKYQGIYGDRGLRTETTWLNHNQVSCGTKGAPRIDVLDINANWSYDYNFTINPPGLSPAQTQRIMNHGPRGLGGVTEINP